MKPSNAMLAVLGLGAALVAGTGCQDGIAAEKLDGKGVYGNYCAQCHGNEGAGNAGVGAPSIAGLPAWYVQDQVGYFKEGYRGRHFDDVMGMKMRPMALALTADVQIENVAKYVESMPVQKQAATLDGDAEKGASYFGTCVACHGADAAGMKAVNSPPLHQADDWYMLTQLKNFKAGVRGSAEGYTTGAQMMPMANTLPDEQAMKDVIAHIRSLDK